jgi:hypothetical protein
MNDRNMPLMFGGVVIWTPVIVVGNRGMRVLGMKLRDGGADQGLTPNRVAGRDVLARGGSPATVLLGHEFELLAGVLRRGVTPLQ